MHKLDHTQIQPDLKLNNEVNNENIKSIYSMWTLYFRHNKVIYVGDSVE